MLYLTSFNDLPVFSIWNFSTLHYGTSGMNCITNFQLLPLCPYICTGMSIRNFHSTLSFSHQFFRWWNRKRSNNASISIIVSFFLPTFATAFLTGSLFFQECCICLSSYEDGAELSALPCNHHFHWTCITKWLRMHATCPLCKYNILKGSDST